MLAQTRKYNVCRFWSVYMKFAQGAFLSGCVAAVLLAGCSTGTIFPVPSSSPQGSSAPSASPKPSSSATATATPTQSATPSPALSSLIYDEDFFEQAAAGEQVPPASGQYIVAGQTEWQTKTRALVAACPGVTAALLPITDAAMAAAVSAANTSSERRAANTVTKDLAGFFEACGYNQPNEMILLDAIGRNIIIDATDQPPSWAQANLDLQSLQTTWAQVRPEVVARPNSAVAVATYDADISKIASDLAATAPSTATIISDTGTLQNDFDAMEMLF
jgi:hypothetical protein